MESVGLQVSVNQLLFQLEWDIFNEMSKLDIEPGRIKTLELLVLGGMFQVQKGWPVFRAREQTWIIWNPSIIRIVTEVKFSSACYGEGSQVKAKVNVRGIFGTSGYMDSNSI